MEEHDKEQGQINPYQDSVVNTSANAKLYFFTDLYIS